MRITARIASSGSRWSPEFPRIDRDACFPKNADGKREASPSGCMRSLSSPLVQHSGNDTDYLRAVVCRFIDCVNTWKDDNCADASSEGVMRSVASIRRRSEGNRVNYARCDWTHCRDGLHVNVSHTSRDSVVETEQWEVMFAQIMAEAAVIVRDEIAERPSHPQIVLSPQTQKLYDDLSALRSERREDAALASCERRVGGYCSPSNAECRYFRSWRCIYGKKD